VTGTNPRASRKLPTSVDVARQAGVSQATVSRALNGGSVSAETRKRIIDLAAKLGYSRNAVARGLVMNRSGLIGVIVADITNPFYPELLEAIGARLDSIDHHMLVQNAAAGTEAEAAELLLQQRVDGIIFTTALRNSDSIQALVKRGFPVVLSNRVTDAPCDSVQGDNVAGASAAADLLVSLGHTRIATLKGSVDTSTSSQRSKGFAERLSQHGLALQPRFDLTCTFSYEAAYEATATLLARRWPPTAIFCHNDLMAFAAINAARGANFDVPGDLSIIGYDNVRQAAWESFNLTTVSQPVAEMAESAVRFLGERIADPERPPQGVVFPCELVVRGTTGPSRRGGR
jgi:LacI family transcriptional regulator